ncbi:hypothetical protein B0H13DRAFT_1910732 [Mycena leptocephala]|nr:hypothetical protein B0H13DRAFT_1910732 [Mycena leptocephala]
MRIGIGNGRGIPEGGLARRQVERRATPRSPRCAWSRGRKGDEIGGADGTMDLGRQGAAECPGGQGMLGPHTGGHVPSSSRAWVGESTVGRTRLDGIFAVFPMVQDGVVGMLSNDQEDKENTGAADKPARRRRRWSSTSPDRLGWQEHRVEVGRAGRTGYMTTCNAVAQACLRPQYSPCPPGHLQHPKNTILDHGEYCEYSVQSGASNGTLANPGPARGRYMTTCAPSRRPVCGPSIP